MATRLRVAVAADPDARFAQTVARLKAAGRGDMQSRMVARIRRRGQPAVNAAKAAFRSAELPAVPSKGGGASSGLRDRAASAVGMTTTSAGVRIRVDGNKVDRAYGTSLVLALNGMTRLRHPVFGNRSAWVNQKAPEELFYAAIRPFEQQWRQDVEQVMDDIVREIGG